MILSNKQRIVLIIMVLTYFLITLYFWRKYRKEQFENNGKSLFFIHIPKNGGTSIEDSFEKSGIELGRFDNRYYSKIKGYNNFPKKKCSYWHVPPKYTDISFDDHVVFAVIRNPISRIVSEYNYSKHILGKKNPVYDSINYFVEFIYKNYKTDKFMSDCHILPQLEYLYDKNGKMCQNILCQENLQSDLSEFLKKYGFKDVKLSWSNTSNQQEIDDLSPKSMRLINELYKDDIQLWEKSCGNFSTIPASPFPRRIFMYWAQGFDAAPKLVQECLKSWKRAHPKWQIDEIDDSNLSQFIDIKFVSKEIYLAAKSDVIRILLLQKYGGFWCDATLYCMKSIDTWLMPFLSGTEFFAFRNPGVDRMLSSWFLGAIPGSYITSEWANEVKKYWLSRTAPKQYFWFHYLFAEIYKNDPKFKRLWDQSHKLEANGPESPQSIYGFKSFWTGTLNPRFKEHVDSKRAPFYKLNHMKEIVKNGNLNYLVNN